MATALYATILTAPSNVREIKAYLYSDTEIVATAMVTHTDRDLAFLILRTETEDAERTAFVQQYQADRLASGMHGMTIGFVSRAKAEAHAQERAYANDWGLAQWHPGSALVPAP